MTGGRHGRIGNVYVHSPFCVRRCCYCDFAVTVDRRPDSTRWLDTIQTELKTLQAAAGFVVHLFPTGQGNIIGNPIEPVIKLTANPRTVRTMGEHVDVDVSGILRREMNLDEAGDALLDMTIRTCNGRLTAAEALGHREFVMTKLYRSA